MVAYDPTSDTDKTSMAREPIGSYLSSYSIQLDTWWILTLADGHDDQLLQEVINNTGLTQQFWATDVFQITPKTLTKYKQGGMALPARMSEIAINLIYLFKVGREVFVTNQDLIRWLQLPAYGLHHRVPATLLKTGTGVDMVEDLVCGIEYGATA